MINSLSSVQKQPFTGNNAFFPHELKVNKVAAQFFAAITFAIGILTLITTSSPFVIFIALPCFATTGALIWQIQRMKDYSDPSTLAKYRKEAAQKTLQATIKEHGWENMMHYGIPEKSVFPQKFRETAAQLTSIVDILDLYEDAARFCPSDLKIPEPIEFAETFKQETKELFACDILEKYDVDRLHKHGLVTDDLKATKQEFELVKQNRLEKLKHIQDDLRAKLNDPVMRTFQDTLRPVRLQNPAQGQILSQLRKESAYLIRNTITHWFDNSLLIFKGDLGDDWGEYSLIPEAVLTFRSEAEAQRLYAEELIRALDQGYFQAIDAINARFSC